MYHSSNSNLLFEWMLATGVAFCEQLHTTHFDKSVIRLECPPGQSVEGVEEVVCSENKWIDTSGRADCLSFYPADVDHI